MDKASRTAHRDAVPLLRKVYLLNSSGPDYTAANRLGDLILISGLVYLKDRDAYQSGGTVDQAIARGVVA